MEVTCAYCGKVCKGNQAMSLHHKACKNSPYYRPKAKDEPVLAAECTLSSIDPAQMTTADVQAINAMCREAAEKGAAYLAANRAALGGRTEENRRLAAENARLREALTELHRCVSEITNIEFDTDTENAMQDAEEALEVKHGR